MAILRKDCEARRISEEYDRILIASREQGLLDSRWYEM